MTPNYSNSVLDHFYHSRRAGKLPETDPLVYVGISGSAAGGEMLKIYLRVVNHVVTDARFQAYGCCATIAVGSWLMEYCLNKNIDRLSELSSREIIEALSLPTVKQQAALLGEDAIRCAISNMRR